MLVIFAPHGARSAPWGAGDAVGGCGLGLGLGLYLF